MGGRKKMNLIGKSTKAFIFDEINIVIKINEIVIFVYDSNDDGGE